MTIGNPFDVLATGLQLKYTLYCLYDSVLRKSISEPFKSRKFLKLQNLSNTEVEKMEQTKSLFDFDKKFSARFFEFNSAHQLYRQASCGPVIPYVDVPFLVLLSNDDPVVKVELVPHGDLLRNKNCVLVEANVGGHCDFFCKLDG